MKKEKANPKPVWAGSTNPFITSHVTADFFYVSKNNMKDILGIDKSPWEIGTPGQFCLYW